MKKKWRQNACGQAGKLLLQTLILTVCLWLGTEMPQVQAKSSLSHGNLIYEDGRERVGLYAADILLLEEKLSTIPERCFDPVCYAHIHHWEYRGINERTHTKHCADCGDRNDLTNAHKAVRAEDDTIYYGGKTYPGRRYTCACGYQWRMELNHTMTYEAVDAVNHRGGCELDGTPYCRGCEPSVEEHYAWYYEAGEKDGYHRKICFDCGYCMEEACHFEEPEGDENLRVCICGRTVVQEEEGTLTEKSETPKTPPETPEEPEVQPEEPETPPEGPEPSKEPEVPPKGPEPSKEPEVPPEGPESSEEPEMPPETPETPEPQPEGPESPESPALALPGMENASGAPYQNTDKGCVK